MGSIGWLTWLWRALRRDKYLLGSTAAPSAESIRSGAASGINGDLGWLIKTVGPKARAGTLQEEAILVALEDRLIHGTPYLRELSAICILSALALTFFRIHRELPSIFGNGPLTPDTLAPLVSLVGANWLLIAAGLLFHFFSIIERIIKVKRFDVYREWLEREIFPQLGVARSTGDRLAAALETFSRTVADIKQALFPLSGLPSALLSFQQGLIGELIPSMSKGLEGIKIGLSDSALLELRTSTLESTKALREMKDHQAKMLTLITSGERRTAELAVAVESIATQTSQAAKALEEQVTVIRSNNDALTQLRTALGKSTEGSRNLVSGIDRLNVTTIEHAQRIEAQTNSLSEFRLLLPRIGATLIEVHTALLDVQTGLASLTISESGLQAEVEQSRGEVISAKEGLIASLRNAEVLQVRWEEAMLQMASLVDEFSGRTLAFEQSTTDLSSIAGKVALRLEQVESALGSIGSHVENLSGSTKEIAAGNKSLVAAFGDLQIASQKLKNLGHAVTGHFNIWQEQTRKVYDKAEKSTENIGTAFNRIGEVVLGMESVLRELAEVVSRAEHVITTELQSSRERPEDSSGEGPAVVNA